MKDLFGNEIAEEKKGARNVFACIGASNHSTENRQSEDFYATELRAVEDLLEREKFSHTVLEPCVGQGHIANVLTRGGVRLYSE